ARPIAMGSPRGVRDRRGDAIELSRLDVRETETGKPSIVRGEAPLSQTQKLRPANSRLQTSRSPPSPDPETPSCRGQPQGSSVEWKIARGNCCLQTISGAENGVSRRQQRICCGWRSTISLCRKKSIPKAEPSNHLVQLGVSQFTDRGVSR